MVLPKQMQQLFDWLKNYIRANDRAPTYREIMQVMGLKSMAKLQTNLKYLREHGYIEWQKGQPRTIRILCCIHLKSAPNSRQFRHPVTAILGRGETPHFS